MIPAKGAFTPPTSAEEHTMAFRFADIAFTPAVQALQDRNGSRRQYARMQARSSGTDQLGPDELEFLSQADSFYLATVSETGWPYVQHRGGPRGFLKALSPAALAFADFRGNQQFVSAGNVSRDDRAALIVMDHADRRRLKLLGHLRFADAAVADPGLLQAVALPGYAGRVYRIATIEVEAFDWNCPQHITQRFTLEQVEEAVYPLRARIAELEAQVRALQAGERSDLS
jgi:predicted pyridoxine 5'-phosphate oxidase superfamily flavin-nucleotide-binding protein